MKKIFLDTNILLDVFLEREPHCRPAQLVWSLAEEGKVKAAISALSVANVFYIIRRLGSVEKGYAALDSLRTFVWVDATARLLSRALQARFGDFEDAVQYYSALKFGAKAILSRDPSGFREGRIEIMDCTQYLSLPTSPGGHRTL